VRGGRKLASAVRRWPWLDPLLPRQLRHGAWLSVVVLSAVAAATLTVTASGAQTRNPFSPAAQLAPSAEDDDDGGQPDGVSYGFEQPGDLRGWDAAGVEPLVDDTAVVHDGERSLGVVVDTDGGGRRIDVTASLRELSRPPTFGLARAKLTCYVHTRGSADASTLLGAMVVVDGEDRADLGPRVAVTADRWTALTMIVGAVEEPSADGRPVRQDDGFDGRNVVTFGIRLRAASGALPQAFNVDDCTVEPADDEEAPARSMAAAPPPPIAAPIGPAPAPAPETHPTPRVDGPGGGRDGDGQPSNGGSDDDDADGADAVGYGFEDRSATRGWTAQDATLGVDRNTAMTGGRSLGVVPDDDAGDRVAVRARLAALRPTPGFRMEGSRLTCHVRGVPSQATGDLYAVLVAEDGGGGQDAGAIVELTGQWSAVSLVVGSGTPDPAQGFDADDVVSFAVHIAATSGVLPTALNIDDCEAARSRSGRR
jgi:hypothetical protein